MHIFKKRDDSELHHMLAEILRQQAEILSLLKAMPDPREELARLIDQRIRQIKAPRKTD